MALRLRRGTNAERLTITPVESELIYATDTKELWIGDGVTVGGNKIGGLIPQFLSDLDNVDADSPQIGQVLKWDGGNWIATDDNNTGVIEGSNYRINIVGDDSEIIVDGSTNTFTGTFVGDGSGLTNLPISLDGSGIVEGSNYRINIVDDSSTVMVNTSTGTFTGNGSGLTNLPSIFELNNVFSFTPPDAGDVLTFDGANFVPRKIRVIEGDDSTVILDATTNTFTGNFVGDGSGLTNLPSISITGSVFDLDDVFAPEGFTPDAGDVLTFDGANFVSRKIRVIEGDDSTVILDATTNTFTGNFVGDGSGLTNLPSIPEGSDYRINIIGDDSTLLVDGVNNAFNTNGLTLQNNVIKVTVDETPVVISSDGRVPLQTQSVTTGTFGGYPAVDFASVKGSFDTPQFLAPGDIIGGWKISGYTEDDQNEQIFKAAAIVVAGFEQTANLSDESPASAMIVNTGGGGTSFNLFQFNSIGQFIAPGPISPGTFADVTARDAAITTPTAGMMIFVADSDGLGNPKFQGYDGTAWVNLN